MTAGRAPATAPGETAGHRPHRTRVLDLAALFTLAVVALALRLPAIGPSSLWLDDAWAALVVKADGLADLGRVAVTAPGHTLLLAGWLDAVGFSATAAQLPALAAGVATPPAVYALARWFGWWWPAALLGGAAVASSPVHAAMSARVKPFTLDALLAVVLAAIAWWVVQGLRAAGRSRPSPSWRWGGLVVASVAATTLTAGVAPAVAAAFAATGIAARGRQVQAWVLATVAYGLVAAAWWSLVLRPRISPPLTGYWRTDLLDLSGPGAFAADLATSTRAVLAALVGMPWPLAAAALVVGVVALAARDRVQAVLVVTPVVVAVALAAAQLAPYGGGRTDTVLIVPLALLVGASATALDMPVRHQGERSAPRPPASILASTAAPIRASTARPAALARRRSRLLSAAALAAVAAAALLVAVRLADRPAYPDADTAPLVRAADASPTLLLVHPSARWAFALYTGAPLQLIDDPTLATGFDVEVAGDVALLDWRPGDAAAYRHDVAAAVAGTDEVKLLASHTMADLDLVEQALRQLGFDHVETVRRPGALLSRWRRR